MLDGLFAPMHILVILVVALLVLGPKQLPHAAHNAARALGEIRRVGETLRAEARALLEEDTEAFSTPAPDVASEGEDAGAGTDRA